MKKVILLLAFAAGTLMSFAQDNVVKLNPIGALFGNINIGYERVVSEDGSAQLNVGIVSRKFEVLGSTWKYSGFSFSPEYRHHIGSHENPKGPYVGGFAVVNSIKSSFSDDGSGTGSSSDTELKYTGIGAGALIGYQWILAEAFALDLTVGAGYQSVSVDTDTSIDNEPSFGLVGSGILPKFSFAIGYAF